MYLAAMQHISLMMNMSLSMNWCDRLCFVGLSDSTSHSFFENERKAFFAESTLRFSLKDSNVSDMMFRRWLEIVFICDVFVFFD
jgi:hypothetical protein